MDFVCARCDGKSFTTLRGWKMHMSATHGGYDEADMAQALRGAGTPEDDVRSRMAGFAATIPSDGGEQQEGDTAGLGTSPPEKPPAPPPMKTIKATPKRLKKIIGTVPAKIFESAKIELDDEDKEALDEAGEFLVDLFALEFEVEQSKTLVHSRFWAFVWVAGVCALIYVKHRFKDVWKNLYDAYQEKKLAAEKNV